MVRRIFQGILFVLLLLMLAAVVYGAWVYHQTGTLPLSFPGVATTPGGPTATPTITPTPTPTPVMRPAVVASTNLPAGTLLTADMLIEADLPSNTLPHDAVTHKMQVVGQLLREPLQAGEVVRLSNVVPRGQVIGKGSPLAQMLEPGEVAIAYPVSRLSSVAYAPRPGDTVDVVVTFLFTDTDLDFQSQLPNRVMVLSLDTETRTYAFRPAGTLGHITADNNFAVPIYVVPSEDQRPRMVALLSIHGARVLYFGTSMAATPAADAATPPPDIVVLGVSPQDAVVLNFFMARQAATTLLLDSAQEGPTEHDPEAIPVTLDYIQEHFGVPLPPKLPQQVNPSGSTPTPRP